MKKRFPSRGTIITLLFSVLIVGLLACRGPAGAAGAPGLQESGPAENVTNEVFATNSSGTHSHTADSASQIDTTENSGNADESRPVNVALQYCIKT